MNIFKCKVCYNITFAVFISILIVEGLILLPSVKNYEKDELERLSYNATNVIKSALVFLPEDDKKYYVWSLKVLKVEPVKGFIIFDENKNFILKSGDSPVSVTSSKNLYWLSNLRTNDGTRYDTSSEILLNGKKFFINMRINTEDLNQKLLYFIIRIIGLVAIIAAFVTIASMIVLNNIILKPILLLRKCLDNATYDVINLEEYSIEEKRKDEIGDLFIHFNEMIKKIGGFIHELQHKEQELKELNDSLEVKVMARTKELREEILERKMFEKKLILLSNYDTETDLPNLTLFKKTTEDYIQEQKSIYVAAINLNDFQEVRNSFGLNIAVEHLKIMAEKVKDILPVGSLVARTGPTKLGVVYEASHHMVYINDLIELIITKLTEPVKINQKNVVSTINVGLSFYPTDASTTETLISNSEVALSESLKYLNTYRFHDIAANKEIVKKRDLLSDLHQALKKNEFFLVYQPKVCMKTGKIRGAEALIRWNHSTLGLIPPDKFINIAEQTGLIIKIGEWVAQTACKQTKEWQDSLGVPLKIAVNLSTIQFKNRHIVHTMRQILSETGLNPHSLELEITESAVMENVEDAINIMRAFNDLGISLSVDDFGTGHSSLNYLKNFPIKGLKIDRAFVNEINLNNKKFNMIDAIIHLGRILNLSTVAEGIEIVEQHEYVKEIDCDEGQGYFYSKPLVAEEFTELLSSGKTW